MTNKEFEGVARILDAAKSIKDEAELICKNASQLQRRSPIDKMMAEPEAPGTIKDGIYLVCDNEIIEYTPAVTEDIEDIKQRCCGVGVKLGGKSIIVALKDFADRDDITLTCRPDRSGRDGYKNNYEDAGADWDGAGNTEHLKAIGLNSAITLSGGWYIPAVAQWRFICLFRKEINQALKELDGDELSGWYWTSTEYSATRAWYLHLSNGNLNYYTKASNRHRVRAVSAFIS